MYKRLITSAVIFGAAALAPPAAHAQTPTCAPRAQLVDRLASSFSESLTGGGLQNARQMIEIWSSPETGTFTVLLSRADGVSCIVAAGQNWNSVTPTVRDSSEPG